MTEPSKTHDTPHASPGMIFSHVAHWTSRQCGRPFTFTLACAIILIWAITGPFFHYSDTWQLIINTGTTIVTFLMVFLIQNTQNRDMTALHLKLDELIRATDHARNTLMVLEDMTEEELDRLKTSFTQLSREKPQDALLREAGEDLETAKEEIQQAKEKLAAAAGKGPSGQNS